MQLGGLDSQYLDNEYTYRKLNQDRCGQTVHENGHGHLMIYFDLFCSYIPLFGNERAQLAHLKASRMRKLSSTIKRRAM